MNDKLATLLMRHLTLLDSAENASILILDAACRLDIDLVHFEMANRDRIVKLIELFQSNIEVFLNEYDDSVNLDSVNSLIKVWANDLNRWVERIDILDNKTTELLDNQKQNITKEISTVYTSSENLKGYNLNNVTK